MPFKCKIYLFYIKQNAIKNVVNGGMAPRIRNLGTRIRFTPSGHLMSQKRDQVPTG